jgi:polysaccharide export outer membrane protein
MVRAIWAVACSILLASSILISLTDPLFAQDPPGISKPGNNPPAPIADPPPARQSTSASQVALPDNPANQRRPIIGSTNSMVDPSYRLGAEDQLRISVWDNKDLTLDLVVRPDGKISMPLLHDLVAEGLTPSQLATNIQKGLSAFILNPEVSVIVLQVNAPKYYITGYVSRPGMYSLRGDTSVLQALALAGGLTQFASPKSIKLIRVKGGKQVVQKINFYNIIEDGGEGNYLLRSGDTIVVP